MCLVFCISEISSSLRNEFLTYDRIFWTLLFFRWCIVFHERRRCQSSNFLSRILDSLEHCRVDSFESMISISRVCRTSERCTFCSNWRLYSQTTIEFSWLEKDLVWTSISRLVKRVDDCKALYLRRSDAIRIDNLSSSNCNSKLLWWLISRFKKRRSSSLSI